MGVLEGIGVMVAVYVGMGVSVAVGELVKVGLGLQVRVTVGDEVSTAGRPPIIFVPAVCTGNFCCSDSEHAVRMNE